MDEVILGKLECASGVIYLIGGERNLSYHYFEIGLEIYFHMESILYF